MRRRRFVGGLGGLVASGAVGTSAFESVEAERGVSVELADDARAYLAMRSTSPYSEVQSGRLKIVDTDTLVVGGRGKGVGGRSQYFFDAVFEIENRGTRSVYVWADLGAPRREMDEVDDVFLYAGENRDSRLDGDEAAVPLTPGEVAQIGVCIDTPDLEILGDFRGSSAPGKIFANRQSPKNG